MKTIKDVKSQSKPDEIDDYSSQTTVFVRSNIKEVDELDPVFKTTRKIFIYDEIQYSYPEWNKIITDSIKTEGALIQEQVDITQLAMSEIILMIGEFASVAYNNTSTIAESINTLSINNYSAIAKMYAGMINRKLIKIEDVSDTFKNEVLEYIKTQNKE